MQKEGTSTFQPQLNPKLPIELCDPHFYVLSTVGAPQSAGKWKG